MAAEPERSPANKCDVSMDNDDSIGNNVSDPALTAPWYRRYWCRGVLVLMSFLGCANMYAMRVNLSLTIVAMVNHTAIKNHKNNDSAECPAPWHMNSTESEYSEKLEGPFAWDENTQGTILSGFFIGYVFTQIPGGRIAEYYGGKWVFGVGVALTGLFTLLTAVAAEYSTGLLVAARIAAGMAEGVTFPALMVMIAHWSKPDERSMMTSFAFNGVKFGTVVVLPLAGLLINQLGWESVFYVTGGVSLVWFVVWIFVCFDSPQTHPRISKCEKFDILTALDRDPDATHGHKPSFPTPWKALLTSVPFYAILLTHLCHAFAYYVSLTQISKYMANALHFDIEKNALLAAVPYLVSWIFGVLAPMACDMAISRQLVTTTVARKIANTVGTFIPGVALLVLAFSGCDAVLAVSMLTLAVGANGAIYAGERTAIIDIAPNFAGTIMGFVNMLGSGVMGIVAPKVTGAILQGNSSSLAHWQIVWLSCAAIIIVGTVIFLVFGTAEVQPWNEPPPLPEGKDQEEGGYPTKEMPLAQFLKAKLTGKSSHRQSNSPTSSSSTTSLSTNSTTLSSTANLVS